MSIYSVNILFRLSVGNVTKGFSTYRCFHPCFIYLEPGSSTSPPDGISCYMCGYMVMDNGQPQQISDDIPLCSEGVSYALLIYHHMSILVINTIQFFFCSL